MDNLLGLILGSDVKKWEFPEVFDNGKLTARQMRIGWGGYQNPTLSIRCIPADPDGRFTRIIALNGQILQSSLTTYIFEGRDLVNDRNFSIEVKLGLNIMGSNKVKLTIGGRIGRNHIKEHPIDSLQCLISTITSNL